MTRGLMVPLESTSKEPIEIQDDEEDNGGSGKHQDYVGSMSG